MSWEFHDDASEPEFADPRLAAEALRESERRLQLALAAGRMVAIDVDYESGSVVFSDNAAEILGIERSTLEIGSGIDLVHPDDRAEIERVMARGRASGIMLDLQFRMIRPDSGRVIWVERRSEFVRDAGGRVIGTRGVLIDISERRRAEEAAGRGEARYHMQFQHAPEAIVTFDVLTGGFVEANAVAERLFGRSAQELQRFNPAELSPECQPDGRRSAEAARGIIERALAGECPVFEWMHRNAAGEDIPCEVRLVQLPGEPGQTLIRGSILDMRERRRLELVQQHLLESRAEWEALAAQAPDLIAKIDRSGIIRFVNRTVPPLTPADVIGQHWLGRVTMDHPERAQEAFDTVLASKEPTSFDALISRPDGSKNWYWTRLGPILSNGEVTGVVAVARDITQKKEREAQLFAADRMASVGVLAAGVAHELNNPLAAVLANLELAERRLASSEDRYRLSEFRDEIRDARDAAERARQIVRDLKVFSRAEDDRRAPINLISVVESTLRLAWPEIRHRARLVKSFGAVPLIDANEARLGQVILNLVVNAAQAIPEGNAEQNEIRIVTRVDGSGRVALDIFDSGAGMSEEVQQRLFTPFFSTKPIGTGTGLGLSICQRIVSALGGEIQVKSQVGKGSTFSVLLPPSAAPSPAILPARPTLTNFSAVAPRARGRVLVIDDEPIIGATVRRALASEHEVLVVTHAVEAIERLRAGEHYDVIICDLMMPQVTGMDFYQTLSGSHPAQADRVIFLTGGAFTPRARQFLDTVRNTRIEKPFNIQELRSLVNERVLAP